jgi:hypothetical protein
MPRRVLFSYLRKGTDGLEATPKQFPETSNIFFLNSIDAVIWINKPSITFLWYWSILASEPPRR